ncbi:MAG: selenium binding protein [Firmicutes bacterium]|nr:selenium binding protein [Bacillota bacterium]
MIKTRIPLPENDEYLKLLGVALYMFNYNNSSIIEAILSNDTNGNHNWYDLIDVTSGKMRQPAEKAIIQNANSKELAKQILTMHEELIRMRNRIIHSYPTGVSDEYSSGLLYTKDKEHNQYVVGKEYLEDFIKKNDEFAELLSKFRGH